MNRKTIMAMPVKYFWAMVVACAAGIVAGSFFDFNINVALANKTIIGAFFATYGSYFSYCLYPAAGACLFVGLRKKGSRYNALAWTLLVVGWFMAVYYSNSYNGSKVRELFGYVAGESAPIKSVLSWLFWVALYAWVAPVVVKLADDSDPDRLIAVGAAILVAGIVADVEEGPSVDVHFARVVSPVSHRSVGGQCDMCAVDIDGPRLVSGNQRNLTRPQHSCSGNEGQDDGCRPAHPEPSVGLHSCACQHYAKCLLRVECFGAIVAQYIIPLLPVIALHKCGDR